MCRIYTISRLRVLDKLSDIIGPKIFLFGTAKFSLWASGIVNFDFAVTNSINSVNWIKFPMVHTLTIVEPIWPMLQNISKPLSRIQLSWLLY